MRIVVSPPTSASAPLRLVLVGLMWVHVLAGCSRTWPGRKVTPSLPLSASDGGAEPTLSQTADAANPGCDLNADCDDESICIDHECTFFGECLRDFHCGERHCSNNKCVGPFGPPGLPGEGTPCEINADCGESQFCVGGTCQAGVECRKHAHCMPEHACIGIRCLPY